ncbi:MAG: hypothetical protein Q7T55_22475, partial [Solirubrobacteraceae bacterium]|nr:hypothetical protein [Solirubrobacteraceae bacterium]
PAGSSTGTAGPKGDQGEKGETGATGPQGIQGPAGEAAPGGGGHGFASHLASVQSIPLVDIADTPVTTITEPGAGSYLLNAVVGLKGAQGSGDLVTCKLVAGGVTASSGTSPNVYVGAENHITLVGAVTLTDDQSVTVACREYNNGIGNVEVTRADMTALAVGQLTTSS